MLSSAETGNLDVDSPYNLTVEQINFYRTNGFIKLKDVFSPATLTFFRQEFSRLVTELNTQHLPLAERNTYQKAFLQVTNLWQHSELVKRFVLGQRLARIATELMGTNGVRLYHDQALYKESSGGITPWHADQYYWPLSNNHTITVWIPLQPTPLEMGPLAFGSQSQRLEIGRDLQISDESEEFLQKTLREAGIREIETAFDLGEVSFHSGWTFHRAGPNTSGQVREVMTIIYMDKDMRLAVPKNQNQVDDWHSWCPGVSAGELIDTPINPVIWQAA